MEKLIKANGENDSVYHKIFDETFNNADIHQTVIGDIVGPIEDKMDNSVDYLVGRLPTLYNKYKADYEANKQMKLLEENNAIFKKNISEMPVKYIKREVQRN